MATITTSAHDLTDEFEATIKQDYGVVVTNRDHSPWDIQFSGPYEGLVKMLFDHWGDDVQVNYDAMVNIVMTDEEAREENRRISMILGSQGLAGPILVSCRDLEFLYTNEDGTHLCEYKFVSEEGAVKVLASDDIVKTFN